MTRRQPQEAAKRLLKRPKWSQEEPKRVEEVIQSHKSNQEPHQDEHMTDLDPAKVAIAYFATT